MGINGSKQAYQTAITQFCQQPPAILISHTHNGWIDTALAIGIPGAIILLIVMLNYAAQGFRMFQEEGRANPFAIALFVSAVVWVLRGILDSTLRDHTLEMQAFTFALLLVLAIQFHKEHDIRLKPVK
jgi:O-antigen ligase